MPLTNDNGLLMKLVVYLNLGVCAESNILHSYGRKVFSIWHPTNLGQFVKFKFLFVKIDQKEITDGFQCVGPLFHLQWVL